MKKVKIIISAILITAVSISLIACAKDKTTANTGDKTQSTKAKDNKDTKFVGRWGNSALGISYLVPYKGGYLTDSTLYPHGQFLQVENLDYVVVDASLNNTNVALEDLSTEIYNEKQEVNYMEFSWSYDFKIDPKIPKKTKKIKLGDIDTLYYEQEITGKKSRSARVFGYAFEFNNRKMIVEAMHEYHPEDKATDPKEIDITNQYLKEIIKSLKVYNGESFEVINDGDYNFNTLFEKHEAEKIAEKFYVMSKPDHSKGEVWFGGANNLELAHFSSEEGNEYRFFDSKIEELTEAKNIVPVLLKYRVLEAEKLVNWKKGTYRWDILDTKNVKISGIDMIRTTGTYNHTDEDDNNKWKIQEYWVAYSFVADGIPCYIGNSIYVVDYPNDKAQVYKGQCESQLDNFIRTLKVVNTQAESDVLTAAPVYPDNKF